MKEKLISLQIEYLSEELISILLDAFGWDFEALKGKMYPIDPEKQGAHAVHEEKAAEGTLEDGFFASQAWVCGRCYNESDAPAKLSWWAGDLRNDLPGFIKFVCEMQSDLCELFLNTVRTFLYEQEKEN